MKVKALPRKEMVKVNNSKIKAVIIKTEGKYMKVATEDRRFLTLPLPEEGALAGEELWLDPGQIENISSEGLKKPSFLARTRALAAAVVVVMVLVGMAYSFMFSPRETAAYLALDINPGLELAIDYDNEVKEITPYNTEGEELLAEITLDDRSTFRVLETILEKAKKKEYISSGDENLFLVTLVGVDNIEKYVFGDEKEEEELFSKKLNDSLRKLNISGSIGVQLASFEDREKAREKEESLNSYVLKQIASREAEVASKEFDNKENRDVIEELNKRGLPPAEVFDEFARPGGQMIPPGQEKTPPGQKDKHPAQERVPPSQEDKPPGQEKVPPGLEDVPPGQEDKPPGQKEVPPGKEDIPPGQESTPPGQDTGQDKVPPGEEKRPDPGSPVPDMESEEEGPPGRGMNDRDITPSGDNFDVPPGQKETPDEEKQEEEQEEDKGQEEDEAEKIPEKENVPPGQRKAPPGQEDRVEGE